ncbi:MAG: hypothetical protein EFT35_10285 [Methanophagales archaeon ANME-1-THS]|nr:MAG: hypothetical protein EFT35_10285 [Methanophagales archaeon ANME-1-THS]
MIKVTIPELSFIVGMLELTNLSGSESLYEWLKKIGERIAELEGKGIEGKKMDDVYYLPICPLASAYHYASHHDELSKAGLLSAHVEALKHEQTAGDAALGSMLCVMHHAYRKKRAELAGKSIFHLAARSHLTNEPVFNEEAIERCGKKKEEVEKFLDSGVCIFAYEPE